jgi:2-oxoglutarate ferredoxin oxidoreductase subunit delta
MAVAVPRLNRGAYIVRSFDPLLIATDRCKGCELCIHACPQHCLALDTAVVNRLGYHPIRLTDAAACTSCALCARVCPDVVFTVFAPAREDRS